MINGTDTSLLEASDTIREQNSLILKWYRRIQTINIQLNRNGSASLLVHCCFMQFATFCKFSSSSNTPPPFQPATHTSAGRASLESYNCISSLVVSDLQGVYIKLYKVR